MTANMTTPARQKISDTVAETEAEIRDALQKLHDETGLIPVAVTFDSVDVGTWEQRGKEKPIKVNNVYVKANT